MIDNITNPQLIVSVTSYPHRFYKPEFIYNLQSLVNQNTSVRYKIVLNIFKDEAEYLPQNIKTFVKDNGIEILKCKKNLKSQLKYFYCMKKYNDLPVITVDDDLIYKDNLVEDMWNTHMKKPNCIIAGRVFKMPRDEVGLFSGLGIPYWKLNCEEEDLYQLGCSGVLYPSEFCKSIDDRLLKIIPYWIDDDALLWVMSRICGLKVILAKSSESGLKDGYPYWCGLFAKYILPVSNDQFALCRSKNHLYGQYVQFYNSRSVDELISNVLTVKDSLQLN